MSINAGENIAVEETATAPQETTVDNAPAQPAEEAQGQAASPAPQAPVTPEATVPEVPKPLAVATEDPKKTVPSPTTKSEGDFDWFETRVLSPNIQVESLKDSIGVDGFKQMKPKEEYWKDKRIRDAFGQAYGSYAKSTFDRAYANSTAEFSRFQLGQFQKSQTAYELARDSQETFKVKLVDHAATMNGATAYNDVWVNPVQDIRQAPKYIKFKGADGEESIEEYTPELLKKLEDTEGFDGLAYAEEFFAMDPSAQVEKVYYSAIYNGEIKNSKGILETVKQANIVSRWDLDTGPTNFGLFKLDLGKALANNKLEADSVGDYAKILVRAPLNMAVNVLDTGVQIARATLAGGYGVYKLFNDDGKDLREVEAFKFLSNKGIGLKSYQTSSTSEALKDGFFFSAEAALTTIADISLQVALAGALGRAGAGGARILNSNLSGAALAKAEARAAEITVRSTLTALSVKDTYNDSIENGYSTTEAAVITGAMGIAMWKATALAGYITGDYSVKLARENVKKAMTSEYSKLMQTLFSKVGTSAAVASEQRAITTFNRVQGIVKKVFDDIMALPANQYAYEARQEALEEMTEELFSDGIKQAASAYGALINGASKAGKGRFSSIFDEGYFQDAVERYATSGVAGGFGGVVGNVGNRVALDPISSSSTLTEIILDGKKSELVSVLKEMKDSGAFGPTSLSAEYNAALESFDPLLAGSGEASLPDVIYNNFLHDINVVEAFTNKSVFSLAQESVRTKMKQDLESNSLRKDYVNLMSNLLEFHSSTGISTAIYDELDNMPEEVLSQKVSILAEEKIAEQRAKVEALKATAAASAANTTTTPASKTKAPTDNDDEEEGTTDPDVMLRLEKEAALSGNISKEAIHGMLENYRKVRAIANGSASENYLINNIVGQNRIFGKMSNRDPKYAALGDSPFTDMLSAMRIKAINLEEEQIQKNIKSEEVSNDILAISGSSAANIDKIKNILSSTSMAFLSKPAIDHIISLYEASPKYSAFQEAFTTAGKSSLLPKNPTDLDYMILALEILNIDPYLTEPLDEGVFGGDVTLAKDVINALANQDPTEGMLTVVSDSGLDVEETTLPILGTIQKSSSDMLKNAVALVPKEIQDLKRYYDSAMSINNSKTYYTPITKVKPSISTMFYAGDSRGLAKQSLEKLGMSQVREFLESGINDIYTYSDSKPIASVIEQMEVREAFMELLDGMTPKDGLGGDINAAIHSAIDVSTFRQFRINTLAIIDKKYTDYVLNDTSTENHSYKDYTKTSDFFSDFIYDPILYSEVSAKDAAVHTKADKEQLDLLKWAKINLHGGVVIDITRPIDDLSNIDVVQNPEALDEMINWIASKDIKELEAILADPNKTVIEVPITDADPVHLLFDGAIRFKLAKAVFLKTKGLIDNIASTSTPLPYIEDKKKSIKATAESFKNTVEANPALKEEVTKLMPTYNDSVDPSNTLTDVELAKFNMQLENTFYKIYSNNRDTPMEAVAHDDLVDSIKKQLVQSSRATSAAGYTDATIHTNHLELVAAFTTDLTPFYSSLKTHLETLTPEGKLLIAAQEASAKATAAFIYSKPYKDLLLALKIESGVIKADFSDMLYVAGTAGAGKSSTTSEFGVRIGVEIATALGADNMAALAVAPNNHQVDIIEGSLGALTQGVKGGTFNDTLELLKKAVDQDDSAAMARLDMVGVIVIDEVTYIHGEQLVAFGKLVEKYVAKRASGDISVIIMGDKAQSGIVSPEGSAWDVLVRNTHHAGYLNFSFRGRNSLLVSSINAIKEVSSPAITESGRVKEIIIGKGLTYGTSNDRLYGVNMSTPTDIDSEQGFLDLVNDDELIKNIEKNIAKNKAENAKLAPGAREVPFTVLVAPHDVVSFMNHGTKIKALMENPDTAKYFKMVPADTIGGLEANYVLAELYTRKTSANGGGSGYVTGVGKKLITIATRPFDYVHIINRSDIISIPADSIPEKASEGSVIIPSSRMDDSAKQALVKFYLEILSNIVPSSTAAPLVPVVPLSTVKTEADVVAEIGAELLALKQLSEDPVFLAGVSNMAIDQLKKFNGILLIAPGFFVRQTSNTAMENSIEELAAELEKTNDIQHAKIAAYLRTFWGKVQEIRKTYGSSAFPNIKVLLANPDFLEPAIKDLRLIVEGYISAKGTPAGTNTPPPPPPPPAAGITTVSMPTVDEIKAAIGITFKPAKQDIKKLAFILSADKMLFDSRGQLVTEDIAAAPGTILYMVDADGNIIKQTDGVSFSSDGSYISYKEGIPVISMPSSGVQKIIKDDVAISKGMSEMIADDSEIKAVLEYLSKFDNLSVKEVINSLSKYANGKVSRELDKLKEDIDFLNFFAVVTHKTLFSDAEYKQVITFIETVATNFVEFLELSPKDSNMLVYKRDLGLRDSNLDMTAAELTAFMETRFPFTFDANEADKIYKQVVDEYISAREAQKDAEKEAADATLRIIVAQKEAIKERVATEKFTPTLYKLHNFLKGKVPAAPTAYVDSLGVVSSPEDRAELLGVVEDRIYTIAQNSKDATAMQDLVIVLNTIGLEVPAIKDTASMAAIFSDPDNEVILKTVDTGLLELIQDLYVSAALFLTKSAVGGPSPAMAGVNVVRGFINRLVEDTQVLEHYQAAVESTDAGFTVHVSSFNKSLVERQGVEVIAPEEVSNFINLQAKNPNFKYTKLELMVSKNSRGGNISPIDVILVASIKDTPSGPPKKYAIGQLFTKAENSPIVMGLIDSASEHMKDAPADSISFVSTGLSLKEALLLRPGAIKTIPTAGSVLRLSEYSRLVDVMGSVNVSPNMFIQTGSLANSSENVLDMKGESFVVYSASSDVPVNSDAILDDFNKGKNKEQNLRPVEEEGINKGIGVVRAVIRPPLVALQDFLNSRGEDKSPIKLGEFTSILSLALQKKFLDDYAGIRNSNEASVTVTDYPGGPISIQKSLFEADYNSIAKDYDVYFSKRTEDSKKRIQAAMNEALSLLDADESSFFGSLSNHLAMTIVGKHFTGNRSVYTGPLLSWKSKREGAIFNFENILRGFEKGELNKLDSLMKKFNTPIKFSKAAGQSALFGTLDPDLVTAFKEYIYVPIAGIESPTFTILSEGVTGMSDALEAGNTIVVPGPNVPPAGVKPHDTNTVVTLDPEKFTDDYIENMFDPGMPGTVDIDLLENAEIRAKLKHFFTKNSLTSDVYKDLLNEIIAYENVGDDVKGMVKELLAGSSLTDQVAKELHSNFLSLDMEQLLRFAMTNQELLTDVNTTKQDILDALETCTK